MNILSIFGIKNKKKSKKDKRPKRGLKIKITYDGKNFSADFVASDGYDGHIAQGNKKDVTRKVNIFMINSDGPFEIVTCPQWN